MNFLVVSITLIYVCFTFMGTIMDKNTPFAATRLAQALTASENITMHVDSTDDFPDGISGYDYVWIGEEQIGYADIGSNTTFTNLSRGMSYGNKETVAVAHSANSTVYGVEMSNLNVMIGYKLIEAEGFFGTTFALGETIWMWVKTVPKFLSWNYSFIPDIVLPFLYPVSIGFIVVFALWIKRLVNPVSS